MLRIKALSVKSRKRQSGSCDPSRKRLPARSGAPNWSRSTLRTSSKPPKVSGSLLTHTGFKTAEAAFAKVCADYDSASRYGGASVERAPGQFHADRLHGRGIDAHPRSDLAERSSNVEASNLAGRSR
jgi:hypothetical protein